MRIDSIRPFFSPHFQSKKENEGAKIIRLPVSMFQEEVETTPEIERANSAFVVNKNRNRIIPLEASSPILLSLKPSTLQTFKIRPQDEADFFEDFSFVYSKVAQSLLPEYIINNPDVKIFDDSGSPYYSVRLDKEDAKTLNALIEGIDKNLTPEEVLTKILAKNAVSLDEQNCFNPSTEQKKEIQNRSYKMTEDFFRLSKTKDGFDIQSDFETKLATVKFLEELKDEYGNSVLDDILKAAKRYRPQTDIGFVRDITRFMYHSDVGVEAKDTARLLNYFYSKDPDKEAEIFHGLLEFDEGNFVFSDEDDLEFMDMFELCFDNQSKFDPRAFEALYEIDTLGVDWIANSPYSETGYEPFLRNFVKRIILNYFDRAKDKKTGVFDPSVCPAPDYFAAEVKMIEADLNNI